MDGLSSPESEEYPGINGHSETSRPSSNYTNRVWYTVFTGHLLVTQPAFPITERAQSLYTDLRLGLRPHHTQLSTHLDSEATTPLSYIPYLFSTTH
ncbi:hypothetical protein E2C01_009670 [Portunus trituberculatus]|uniref:Uncharacterized protein n=1 Tax=Portunus trituberculatus TaxID=210409 RepID=A0A5B7D6E3_PORTR|nr:hypothetical protein [Portunus trituberculatus]